MSKVNRQVARGVRLLDKHDPGWVSKMDTHVLNLYDYNTCVLGQVFGRYEEGLHRLRLWGPGMRQGFCPMPWRYESTMLRWIEVIGERQAAEREVLAEARITVAAEYLRQFEANHNRKVMA